MELLASKGYAESDKAWLIPCSPLKMLKPEEEEEEAAASGWK